MKLYSRLHWQIPGITKHSHPLISDPDFYPRNSIKTQPPISMLSNPEKILLVWTPATGAETLVIGNEGVKGNSMASSEKRLKVKGKRETRERERKGRRRN